MSGFRSIVFSGSIRGSVREVSEGFFMIVWNRKDGVSF